MPNHEPVHKLPYIYEPKAPDLTSNVFVVCQSAEPKIMGYIAHSLELKDFEYLIHAGNAYPKMVEMLKAHLTYYENFVSNWMPNMDETRQLLRDIGEPE